MNTSMDASAVKRYLNDLHERITAAVEAVDGAKFRRDPWTRPEGGGGDSRSVADRAQSQLACQLKAVEQMLRQHKENGDRSQKIQICRQRGLQKKLRGKFRIRLPTQVSPGNAEHAVRASNCPLPPSIQREKPLAECPHAQFASSVSCLLFAFREAFSCG